MNLRIRRLGLVLGVLYLLLFVQLNRVQFFGAERLQEDVNNTRGLIREFGRERGPIVTADGVLVAQSVEYDGSVDFRRDYPEGELYAHIVGYQSLNVEATGLERQYNEELAGEPLDQRFASLGDLFNDRDTTATLHLSIRDDVQRVAAEALGERKGSVVALDPRTGEILALWTYPSFDPNPVADPDGFVANPAFDELLADPDDPLLAKSYREVFFPGSSLSTFFESCGVADLITTCYGGRNRRVSEAFVTTGKSIEVLEKEMLNGQRLQGPETAAEVNFMLRAKGMEDKFPLFTSVHRICVGESKPEEFIDQLRNHPEHMVELDAHL